MTERSILLQQIVFQRTERPSGFRIWSDGTVQRCADDNPLPEVTERLDRERPVKWEDDRTLTAEQVHELRNSIRQSGFLNLPPALTINYCKEDPGAAHWLATVDDQTVRVVLWDPKPRRSPEIDQLIAAVNMVLA
jgi:hypothetical protein